MGLGSLALWGREGEAGVLCLLARVGAEGEMACFCSFGGLKWVGYGLDKNFEEGDVGSG